MLADEAVQNVDPRDIPAEQLAVLLEVSRTLGSTLELPVVMQTAIEAAVRVMRLETGAIYLLTGETLFLGATTPALPPDFPDELRRAPLSEHAHIAQALAQRAPLHVGDALHEEWTPAEREVVESRNLRSVLYVPLIADNEAVGAFILSSFEPRTFSRQDVDLSSALSFTIALAVANARLYEAQRIGMIELSRAYDEAQAIKQQLRALATELTAAEERERRHLAVEIHDRVAQPLAVLKMKLHGDAAQHAPHAEDTTFQLASRLLDEAIDEARAIMSEASPPYIFDLGLKPALEWLAERTTSLGTSCECFADDDIESVDEETRLFMFQAARELLANVIKHSDADYASLSAWREDGRLCLKVTDNGRGFPTEDVAERPTHVSGFGLFSLRERTQYVGGSLDVASALGVGTTMTLCVPVHLAHAGH